MDVEIHRSVKFATIIWAANAETDLEVFENLQVRWADS